MRLIIATLMAQSLSPSGALAAGGAELSASDGSVAVVTAIKEGDYNGAITLLKRAIATDREKVEIDNSISYSHRNLSDYAATLKDYTIVLRKDPESRRAYKYVGETYLATGDLAMVKKHLAHLN